MEYPRTHEYFYNIRSIIRIELNRKKVWRTQSMRGAAVKREIWNENTTCERYKTTFCAF